MPLYCLDFIDNSPCVFELFSKIPKMVGLGFGKNQNDKTAFGF